MYVYLHVDVYLCLCVSMCVSQNFTLESTEIDVPISSSITLQFLFLRQGLSLDLELTGSARKAGQQALGIVLFVFPGAVMNLGVKSSAASKQFTNYRISPVSLYSYLFIYSYPSALI